MNNRQAGRRRGRGGQRQGGNPGRPDNGNRIDNRARGNAAQLLEKYKSLARDAQMSGDRVNTEYFLQFADHYFRVLSESRSRMEESNPNAGRGQRDAQDDGDEDDFGFEGEIGSPAAYNHRPMRDDDDGEPRQERVARDDRPQREDRPQRRERAQRDDGNRADGNRADGNREARNGYARDAEPREDGFREAREASSREASPREERPAAANNDEPRRRGRPRREPVEAVADTFDVAVLPPAIGAEPAPEGEKRPRRRRVRDDDEAIPPAA